MISQVYDKGLLPSPLLYFGMSSLKTQMPIEVNHHSSKYHKESRDLVNG